MDWFKVLKQELSFGMFLEDSPKMTVYFEENFAGSQGHIDGFDKVLLDWYSIQDEYKRRTDIGKIMVNILIGIIEEENIHVIASDPDETFYMPLFTLQQWETHIPKFENKTNELRRLVAKNQNVNGEFNRLIGKPHGIDPKDLDEQHPLSEAE